MTDAEQALVAAVEARREALVALTRDLVRLPSVNPPGALNADCAALIADRLAPHGFAIETLRAHGALADSDAHPRVNVIARRAGTGPGPSVHFNSHYDVVPPGEGWTRDPWGAHVENGRIYGRGTCDMKGGLAASMIACAVLADHGGWPGRLELSGVADEETGGYGGAKWLAETGVFAPSAQDHVIIPEPFSPHRICVGHRGVWWAEIETFGRVGHGSMPFLGDCAVRHMGAILHALEADYIPMIEARETAAPVAPDLARRASLNIASLHGGQPEGEGFPAPNVPDRCRLVFDRRLIREEDLDAAKAELRALLDRVAAARGFRYEMRDLFGIAPCHTDEGGPVVSAASSAVADVLGRNAEIVCSPGTYDQRYFDRVAGVTDVIAYGPGELDLAHQPDESVAVEDLVDSAKVMAVAAWRLLHGRG